MMTGRIKREVIDNGGEIEKLWPYVMPSWSCGLSSEATYLTACASLINNTFEQKAIYDLRSSLYNKLQRLRSEVVR